MLSLIARRIFVILFAYAFFMIGVVGTNAQARMAAQHVTLASLGVLCAPDGTASPANDPQNNNDKHDTCCVTGGLCSIGVGVADLPKTSALPQPGVFYTIACLRLFISDNSVSYKRLAPPARAPPERV